MLDMARRLLWLLVISSATAYMIFLVLGSAIYAKSAEASNIVVVRDELGVNAHHLSGMVMVDTTCQELSVRVDRHAEGHYNLNFETWRIPSVDCIVDETPRAFRAVAVAPSTGVKFTATLDGKPLRITVAPVVPD